MSYKVFFFHNSRGESPVKSFIEEQDKSSYAKILRYIKLVENGGPFLKPPFMKKIGEELYELRLIGKISIRIIYTIIRGEYYLLHAFKKKTQKISTRDLKTALDRKEQII